MCVCVCVWCECVWCVFLCVVCVCVCVKNYFHIYACVHKPQDSYLAT